MRSILPHKLECAMLHVALCSFTGSGTYLSLYHITYIFDPFKILHFVIDFFPKRFLSGMLRSSTTPQSPVAKSARYSTQIVLIIHRIAISCVCSRSRLPRYLQVISNKLC